MEDALMALSQAGEFAKQLRDLQTEVEQVGDLSSEVKAIRDDLRLICQPHGSRESHCDPLDQNPERNSDVCMYGWMDG